MIVPRSETEARKGGRRDWFQAAPPAQPSEASRSLSFPICGAEDAGAYVLRAGGRAGRHPAAGSSPLPGALAKGECHGAAGFVDAAPPAHPCAGGRRVTVTNAPWPAVGSEGPGPRWPQSAPCPSLPLGGADKYKNYRFCLTGYERGQDVSLAAWEIQHLTHRKWLLVGNFPVCSSKKSLFK